MLARNLKTIIGYRNTKLTIDLGKEFEGTLVSKMKRDPNGEDFREFDILDNRFLILEESETADVGEETILGRWYFDVRQTITSPEIETQIIYTGTIFFKGNIT